MEFFSQQIILNNRIKVKQHYKYDCGAACLASVAAYYGVSSSLAQIRMDSGCTPDGISMQGIIDAALKMGFEAQGFLSKDKDTTQLQQMHLPAIVHTKEKDGTLHYIVLYAVTGKHAKVMDPAYGTISRIHINELLEKWSGYIVNIYPSSGLKRNSGEKGYLAYLKALITQSSRDLIPALAGTLLCICSGMGTTLLLQQLIDVIIPSGVRSTVILACLMLALAMGFSLFIGYKASKRIIRCSIKVESTIMGAYICKLLKLPPSFFDNYSAGDISSRSDDIHLIRSFITGGITSIATSIITLTVSTAIMVCYNTRMAGMVLCFLPLYWVLYRMAGKISRKWGKGVASANSELESSLLEQISSIQCIRHYNGINVAIKKIDAKYTSLAAAMQHSAYAANSYETAVQLVSRCIVCMVLSIGALAVLSGEMTMGELVGFYSLCAFFTVPLDDLISSVISLNKASVAGRRIYEILSIDDATQDEGKLQTNGLHGNIEISGLVFKYPGREMLFNGFGMTIPEGKITRINGDSGTGKSTLLKLIARDYVPAGGTINYAGINIGQLDIAQWRNIIGYVEQRPSILNATILENIAPGDENPNIGRILQICREIGMDQMLSRFPQGLLTMAGRGGYGLSGGECQKIGIARALYKDPHIFILDESTSSLDKESEKTVAECIHKLRDSGKTIIMVSHKRESAIVADNVVQINRTGSKW